MADAINILIQTQTKGELAAKAVTDSIESGFKRGKLAVDAFNAAAGNGQQAIGRLGVGVKELVAGYLSIEAAKRGFEAMVGILKDGETAQFNLTASIRAANREFENTGSIQSWQDRIKELSKQLVIYSDTTLSNAVSRTVDMTKRLGLSADQMQEVIKRTANLSAGKTDLEGGIERVTSALRGEAEASEYLGLTLNETYVTAWHEAHNAHGRAWKDLTDLEKAQVRYQVFLEQSAAFEGRAAESAKTFSGALQLVDKEINNAVLNNKDLAQAMSDVAGFIRDNAASIGELAADLITLTANVAKFALEWKDVFLALGAVWGVSKGVQLLTSTIAGLQAAMTALRAAKSAQILMDIATASTQARLAGVALSTWMSGGLALAATFAATQIYNLVSAYMEMKKWEDVAKSASQERQKIDDKASQKARDLGKELGININSLADFNRLVKEGALVWDNQTQSWKKATAAQTEQKKSVALTAFQLEQLEKTVKAVGSAYDGLRSRVSGYFDFASERAKTLASNEQEGAQAALQIQRQKLQAMMQIAQQEADQKRQILQASGATEQQVAEQRKQIEIDLKDAKVKALGDWLKALQSAQLQALSDEKKYHAEVLAIQQRMAESRMSFEERIRSAKRQTMTEDKAWLDKQKEAFEILRRAQEAVANAKTPEALKAAEQLAEKAGQKFESLIGEVKVGDTTFKTLDQTVKAATEGMTKSQAVLEEALKRQEEQAKKNEEASKTAAQSYQAELEKVSTKIEELNRTVIAPTAEIKVDSGAIDAKLQELNNTVTHSTHVIHVQSVQESRWGGLMSEGGKLPGWGGGDQIKALLEAGEFVVRKEAVSKYGAGFFQMLNSMRFDLPRIFGDAMPALPRIGYATGGPVGSASDFGTLRLRAGEVELPVQVKGPNGAAMVKQFKRELEKMRLTGGR